MLAESSLLQDLENQASPPPPPLVSLCASMETQHTLFDCTYKLHSEKYEMVAYNKSMSRVRVAVEWIFGDIVKRRFFTESRIVRSKPIRSHGLKHAFTRWRRASFEESF